jgi:hypothetical protein
MPEVVDEGVTGYLVRNAGQAVAAVGRLEAIDRAGCRAHAARRFGAGRMVADYLALYRRLINGPGN